MGINDILAAVANAMMGAGISGGEFGFEDVQAEIQAAASRATAEIESRVAETMSYAEIADDRYYDLRMNKYDTVPAVQMYDGSYAEKLSELEMDASAKLQSAKSVAEVDVMQQEIVSQLTTIATQVQTFLREPTSALEEAKLWDAKFVKSLNEHIPPHYKGMKKDGSGGDTMSQVMEAFRRVSETDMYSIQLFGSQNLINAVYEAVAQGEDALNYMATIVDINNRDMFGGWNLNEYNSVIVPNADTFGGSLLF